MAGAPQAGVISSSTAGAPLRPFLLSSTTLPAMLTWSSS
jgi:hypothetical protein